LRIHFTGSLSPHAKVAAYGPFAAIAGVENFMRSRKKPFGPLLVVICVLVLASIPPVLKPAAAAGCAACHVYLPLVARPLPIPQLDEPADGAQVVSLAPLISWTPAITGTYKIEVSVDPAFPPPPTTEVSATASITDFQPQTHVMGSNLKFGSKIYYWRVGVLFAGSYLFSPIRTFTTPPLDSTPLPPAPTLLAPANRSKLAADSADLQWQAVPGALYYRVRVFAPASAPFDSAIVPATVQSYHVARLAPGVTYTWKVKTLDQHGWSGYGATWSFTAP
jgi:hypothetical protein